jgi:hypothetical protein
MFDLIISDTKFRNSYIIGLLLLAGNLVWLGLVLAGAMAIERLFGPGEGLLFNIIEAVLAAALAGIAGGATASLDRLAEHVSVKQDFLLQAKWPYLILPFSGAIVGVISMVVISIPASMLVNWITHGQVLFAASFSSSIYTALLMLLAWVAGFYQPQGVARLKSAFKNTPVAPSTELMVVNPQAPLSYKLEYLNQKRQLRWSYTWGIFILLYGVCWVGVLLMSYLILGDVPPEGLQSPVSGLIRASWPAMVVGGIGGVMGLLDTLYRQASYSREFQRMNLMAYLVQPLAGGVWGVVMYFLIASGYLSLKPFTAPNGSPQIIDSAAVFALQLVLAWTAGFKQDAVRAIILKLVGDVVAFVKLFGQLLNPLVLFNKTKRDAALAAIGQKTDLFKPLSENEAATPKDVLKWWAPD